MIIGLTGGMGVGKSTIVEILEEKHNVALVKFAAPLYDMQEFVYRRIANVYKKPQGFAKDRKLLQWLGTEWGRGSISDTLWVDLWKSEVDLQGKVKYTDFIISDDTRFDNEAQAIRDIGGIVIKIVSNQSSSRIDTTSGIFSHSSESGISANLVDYVLVNEGSVEDLRNSLATLLELIYAKNTQRQESLNVQQGVKK